MKQGFAILTELYTTVDIINVSERLVVFLKIDLSYMHVLKGI